MFVGSAHQTWTQTGLRWHVQTPFSHCLQRPIPTLTEFTHLCKTLGLKPALLKSRQNKPALLFASHRDPSADSKLIIAGVHGDEPAGVLGVLLFLKRLAERGDLHKYPPFAILPLVSPTAFNLARRTNAWNENANRGYFRTQSSSNEESDTPSREGHTILENFNLLVQNSRAGVLSLHEDVDCEEFYLYSYEKGHGPGKLTVRARDLGRNAFGTIPCDPEFSGGAINHGIIFNDVSSGALDEILFLAGSKTVLVSETPGKRALHRRIQVNADLIHTFLMDT